MILCKNLIFFIFFSLHSIWTYQLSRNNYDRHSISIVGYTADAGGIFCDCSRSTMLLYVYWFCPASCRKSRPATLLESSSFILPVSEKENHSIFNHLTILFLVYSIALPPVLIKPGLASIFACGLVFLTGSLYGMMSLGKK